ncbi:MAG: HdeD family acid-resistance protein [Terrimicrobiaceae bacterium]
MSEQKNKKAGRVWFLIGGILSVLAGIVAIAVPYVTSVVIAQFIGILCVVSGAFLLATAILGEAPQHRIFNVFAALLRIALGVIFLGNLFSAVQVLTLFLAAVFIAEGIFGLGMAWKLKATNPAWIWVLLNGITALVLGGLLFAKFPSDAPWAIGLLFGINSVFIGLSLIMYGISAPKAARA